MLELYILATIGVYKKYHYIARLYRPGKFEHAGKIKGCML